MVSTHNLGTVRRASLEARHASGIQHFRQDPHKTRATGEVLLRKIAQNEPQTHTPIYVSEVLAKNALQKPNIGVFQRDMFC
jgi:hypothetical protein